MALEPVSSGDSIISKKSKEQEETKREDKPFLAIFQPGGGKAETGSGKACAEGGKHVGGMIGSLFGPIGKIAGNIIGEDFGGDFGDFTKGSIRKKFDLKDNFESFTEVFNLKA